MKGRELLQGNRSGKEKARVDKWLSFAFTLHRDIILLLMD